MKRFLFLLFFVSSLAHGQQTGWFDVRSTAGGNATRRQLLATDVPSNFLRSNATNTGAGATIFDLGGYNFDLIAADNAFRIKNASDQIIFQVSGAQAQTITQSQGDNSTKVATTAYVDTGLATKQETLVSGTNIKRINGLSILGSGDITVGYPGPSSGTPGDQLRWDAEGDDLENFTPSEDPTTTDGDLIQRNGGVLARLAAVATGNALISGGVGTASSWGKIGLTTHVSGILPKANGGLEVALTPSDDDFLQYKSGAWANRTIAQVVSDLASSFVTSNTTQTGLSGSKTWSGTHTFSSSQNSYYNAVVSNANTGNAARGGIDFTADGGTTSLYRTSNAFTSGGDAFYINESGGGGPINLVTSSGNFSLTAAGNIGVGTASPNSRLQIVQSVLTAGNLIPAFRIDAGAHTAGTANTERNDVIWQMSRTVQFATGAFSNTQRAIRLLMPTYSFVGASTMTKAVGMALSGPPLAGTNATITTAVGLEVESINVVNGGTAVTTAYGAIFNAPSGAATNYAARFVGTVDMSAGLSTGGLASLNSLLVGGSSTLSDVSAGAVTASEVSASAYAVGTKAYVGGSFMDEYTDANNSGTSETDLYSETTPANFFANDHEKLDFQYSGTFNDATSTAVLRVYFDGQLVGSSGTITVTATGTWTASGYIVRTGSTTARSYVTYTVPFAGFSTGQTLTVITDLSSLSLNTTSILKITAEAGGAGGGSSDITGKTAFGRWYPAN